MKMTIFVNRLEELQKQFNRFTKKANAIGLETSLTIGEPYVKELTVYGYDEAVHTMIDKGTAHVDVVNVSVVFPDYKLGEYDVIGVIDHTLSTKENAVYPCGDWNIPTKYRKGQGICEHCRTNHKRNKTVLLMDKSGEYKQVGTSCLKEYTGITDISLLSCFVHWMHCLRNPILIQVCIQVDRQGKFLLRIILLLAFITSSSMDIQNP